MRADSGKPLVFVVISVLVVALIHSSYSGKAFAEPKDPNWGVGGTCIADEDVKSMVCCWSEPDLNDPGQTIIWCQRCSDSGPGHHNDVCGPIFSRPGSSPTGPLGIPPGGGVLDPGDNASTPSPTGPFPPLQGGGVLQQPPSGGGEGGGGLVFQPQTQGKGFLPGLGILQQQQQQPSTEKGAAAPQSVAPVTPICLPGTVLDEDTNECVPAPQAEEPEQSNAEEPEQQQSSGDDSQDSSNDNSNDNNNDDNDNNN